MIKLLLKRIKRRLSVLYKKYRMSHGRINIVHNGIGSYKKYTMGGGNMIIIEKDAVIDSP